VNLARLFAEKLCPVCGYKLDFVPWDTAASVRACQCCGIHFGKDDLVEDQRESVYLNWRRRWISTGRRWWGKSQPDDYNPAWQMARLEHFANEPDRN
jgi:hypothetical protein